MTWLENWRNLLYFPLGLLPLLFFSTRFYVQWFQSERQKHCVVPTIFWQLSLIGNVLFALHYCIQIHFPLALIQVSNAVISWRNLNLIQSKRPTSTTATIGLLIIALCSVAGIFYLQNDLFQTGWIRARWSSQHDSAWHVFGTLGGILFASRFWMQWWEAECCKQSRLGKTFWWLSITGSLMLISYSLSMRDWVTLIPNCVGLIPYMRNLILLRKPLRN